jgi:hypothetical protein
MIHCGSGHVKSLLTKPAKINPCRKYFEQESRWREKGFPFMAVNSPKMPCTFLW